MPQSIHTRPALPRGNSARARNRFRYNPLASYPNSLPELHHATHRQAPHPRHRRPGPSHLHHPRVDGPRAYSSHHLRRNPHGRHRRRPIGLSAPRPSRLQQLRQPVPAPGPLLCRGTAPLWTGSVGWVDVILAWAFVILRYAHAAIHVTTNHLYSRFAAYAAGLAVLALLWLWLVVRLLILSPSL